MKTKDKEKNKILDERNNINSNNKNFYDKKKQNTLQNDVKINNNRSNSKSPNKSKIKANNSSIILSKNDINNKDPNFLLTEESKERDGVTEKNNRCESLLIQSSQDRDTSLWVPDSKASICYNCYIQFSTLFQRRHHCRICGNIFCNDCSSLTIPGDYWGIKKDIRVCEYCCTMYKKMNKSWVETLIVDCSNDIKNNIPSNKQGSKKQNEERETDDKINDKENIMYTEENYNTSASNDSGDEGKIDIENNSNIPNNNNNTNRLINYKVKRQTKLSKYSSEYRNLNNSVVENNIYSSIINTNNKKSYTMNNWIASTNANTNTNNNTYINNITLTESFNEPFSYNLNNIIFTKLAKELINKLLAYYNINRKHWSEFITSSCIKAIDEVQPSFSFLNDSMDINDYIKIKIFNYLNSSMSCLINGYVMQKNVAYKKMNSNITNPRILIIDSGIDNNRNKYNSYSCNWTSNSNNTNNTNISSNSTNCNSSNNVLVDINTKILQEEAHIDILMKKISQSKANLILISDSISRKILERLNSSTSLVMLMKSKTLKRIARLTKTYILPSSDFIDKYCILGECSYFTIVKIKLGKNISNNIDDALNKDKFFEDNNDIEQIKEENKDNKDKCNDNYFLNNNDNINSNDDYNAQQYNLRYTLKEEDNVLLSNLKKTTTKDTSNNNNNPNYFNKNINNNNIIMNKSKLLNNEIPLMIFGGSDNILGQTLLLSGPNIQELQTLKQSIKEILINLRDLYLHKKLTSFFNIDLSAFSIKINKNNKTDNLCDLEKEKNYFNKNLTTKDLIITREAEIDKVFDNEYKTFLEMSDLLSQLKEMFNYNSDLIDFIIKFKNKEKFLMGKYSENNNKENNGNNNRYVSCLNGIRDIVDGLLNLLFKYDCYFGFSKRINKSVFIDDYFGNSNGDIKIYDNIHSIKNINANFNKGEHKFSFNSVNSVLNNDKSRKSSMNSDSSNNKKDFEFQVSSPEFKIIDQDENNIEAEDCDKKEIIQNKANDIDNIKNEDINNVVNINERTNKLVSKISHSVNKSKLINNNDIETYSIVKSKSKVINNQVNDISNLSTNNNNNNNNTNTNVNQIYSKSKIDNFPLYYQVLKLHAKTKIENLIICSKYFYGYDTTLMKYIKSNQDKEELTNNNYNNNNYYNNHKHSNFTINSITNNSNSSNKKTNNYNNEFDILKLSMTYGSTNDDKDKDNNHYKTKESDVLKKASYFCEEPMQMNLSFYSKDENSDLPFGKMIIDMIEEKDLKCEYCKKPKYNHYHLIHTKTGKLTVRVLGNDSFKFFENEEEQRYHDYCINHINHFYYKKKKNENRKKSSCVFEEENIYNKDIFSYSYCKKCAKNNIEDSRYQNNSYMNSNSNNNSNNNRSTVEQDNKNSNSNVVEDIKTNKPNNYDDQEHDDNNNNNNKQTKKINYKFKGVCIGLTPIPFELYNFSIAKYFKFLLYENNIKNDASSSYNNSCNHSINEDIIRVFITKQGSIRFNYEKNTIMYYLEPSPITSITGTNMSYINRYNNKVNNFNNNEKEVEISQSIYSINDSNFKTYCELMIFRIFDTKNLVIEMISLLKLKLKWIYNKLLGSGFNEINYIAQSFGLNLNSMSNVGNNSCNTNSNSNVNININSTNNYSHNNISNNISSIENMLNKLLYNNLDNNININKTNFIIPEEEQEQEHYPSINFNNQSNFNNNENQNNNSNTSSNYKQHQIFEKTKNTFCGLMLLTLKYMKLTNELKKFAEITCEITKYDNYLKVLVLRQKLIFRIVQTKCIIDSIIKNYIRLVKTIELMKNDVNFSSFFNVNNKLEKKESKIEFRKGHTNDNINNANNTNIVGSIVENSNTFYNNNINNDSFKIDLKKTKSQTQTQTQVNTLNTNNANILKGNTNINSNTNTNDEVLNNNNLINNVTNSPSLTMRTNITLPSMLYSNNNNNIEMPILNTQPTPNFKFPFTAVTQELSNNHYTKLALSQNLYEETYNLEQEFSQNKTYISSLKEIDFMDDTHRTYTCELSKGENNLISSLITYSMSSDIYKDFIHQSNKFKLLSIKCSRNSNITSEYKINDNDKKMLLKEENFDNNLIFNLLVNNYVSHNNENQKINQQLDTELLSDVKDHYIHYVTNKTFLNHMKECNMEIDLSKLVSNNKNENLIHILNTMNSNSNTNLNYDSASNNFTSNNTIIHDNKTINTTTFMNDNKTVNSNVLNINNNNNNNNNTSANNNTNTNTTTNNNTNINTNPSSITISKKLLKPKQSILIDNSNTTNLISGNSLEDLKNSIYDDIKKTTMDLEQIKYTLAGIRKETTTTTQETRNSIKQRYRNTQISLIEENLTTQVDIRVTVFYPRQFEALRIAYCDSYEDFLVSLSKCSLLMDVTGGKSKANFVGNWDGKYIMKVVEKFEFNMFIDSAFQYFHHIAKYLFHKMPSSLAKILGVYEIKLKYLTQEERSDNYYVILMENIAFGKNGNGLSSVSNLVSNYSYFGSFENLINNNRDSKDRLASNEAMNTNSNNNNNKFSTNHNNEDFKHDLGMKSCSPNNNSNNNTNNNSNNNILNKSSSISKGHKNSINNNTISHQQSNSNLKNRITKYDLKGSKQSRYIETNKKKLGHVLMDTNFKEDFNGEPLLLENKTFELFVAAIKNDCLLFGKMNIMDYSMFVIIDDVTNGELNVKAIRLGIIDYVRKYTWDKHLEKLGKKMIYRENPTVDNPHNYKDRFKEAMLSYFVGL